MQRTRERAKPNWFLWLICGNQNLELVRQKDLDWPQTPNPPWWGAFLSQEVAFFGAESLLFPLLLGFFLQWASISFPSTRPVLVQTMVETRPYLLIIQTFEDQLKTEVWAPPVGSRRHTLPKDVNDQSMLCIRHPHIPNLIAGYIPIYPQTQIYWALPTSPNFQWWTYSMVKQTKQLVFLGKKHLVGGFKTSPKPWSLGDHHPTSSALGAAATSCHWLDVKYPEIGLNMMKYNKRNDV